ncbi:MAG: 30S ribosomal protein S3 [Patescibacteria group bacterium]|nr:30S ribosomal protein S3 [Patescibacteria group bacterium]
MGQKVNPVGFRIGITQKCVSQWFAGKMTYAQNLFDDHKIRQFISEKVKDGGINKIEIQRYSDRIQVTIHTSRPGVVIGRQGANLTDLENLLRRKMQKRFEIKVEEIQKPELEARLVAEDIARQITGRVSYRRASKMAIRRTMESGAKGIKILVKGRLGGADIARGEFFAEGQIPLSTLRADISYAHVGAWTTYGQIGVRVWIYRGEQFTSKGPERIDSRRKNK